MARIAGVDLPRDKRVEIALTYIFGIGRPTSSRILSETGIGSDTRVRDLSDAEVARLRQYIERSLRVEGALRTEVVVDPDVEAFVLDPLREVAVGERRALEAAERGEPARGALAIGRSGSDRARGSRPDL